MNEAEKNESERNPVESNPREYRLDLGCESHNERRRK